ncbi:MAG: glycosyltransferase family 9 protein [Candidatus Glassbacteria bacterium]|nr:glycosyltransferase family 9 protein [Candidatus Glassbacteria bacterium]
MPLILELRPSIVNEAFPGPSRKESLPLPTEPSILLVRFSSIGDVLLTTPVIRAVRRRWPGSRVSFLVKDTFAPLLEGNPYLDEIIPFSSGGGVRELMSLSDSLKRKRLFLLADLHDSLRSRLLRTLVPAVETVVYSKQLWKRSLLIYGRLDLFGERILSVPERYAKPLAGLGVELDSAPCELYPGERERDLALEKIRGCWPAGNRLLAVAPGSAWPTKRWPPASFAAAAAGLAQSYGLKVLLLGSGDDSGACRAVEDALDRRVERLNLAGALPLAASAAAVAQSSLLLTNDTGLMHVATAVGTPVVAVFGCTTRHLGYFPYRSEAARVVEAELWCRPCTHNGRRRCPLGHFRCMKSIGPERVAEAGAELLEQAGKTPGTEEDKPGDIC